MHESCYEKVIYSLNGDASLADFPGDVMRWQSAGRDFQLFSHLIKDIAAVSLDREDQLCASKSGLDALVRSYLEPDASDFEIHCDLWEVAFVDETPIGIIQPILYREDRRADRPQGTLHYIGVIPSERGKGYSHDLLLRATSSLLALNVWRIFCDTDVQNAPMIAAFERAGYTRGRIRRF